MSLEQRVLAAHAARPGFTARGFERAGSYDRLAARIPRDARVLDLGCGDGALLARLGPRAIGVDLSRPELALARARATAVVEARAQALPFARGAFDIVACHLAWMLFEHPERVVGELARVLAPGGSVLAVLGGGPVAEPAEDDAFRIFLELIRQRAVALPLAATARGEAGWHAVFAGWDLAPWERHELVLDGSLDEVWAFLAASYELPADPAPIRAELARRLPGPTIRCRAVTWLARATRR